MTATGAQVRFDEAVVADKDRGRADAAGPDRGAPGGAARPAEAVDPRLDRRRPAGGGGRRHDDPRRQDAGRAGGRRLAGEGAVGVAAGPHDARRRPGCSRPARTISASPARCWSPSASPPVSPPGCRRTSTRRSAGCRPPASRPRSISPPSASCSATWNSSSARRNSGARSKTASPNDANPSMRVALTGGALDVDGLAAFSSLFVSDSGGERFADRDLDIKVKAGPVSAGGLTAETVDTALQAARRRSRDRPAGDRRAGRRDDQRDRQDQGFRRQAARQCRCVDRGGRSGAGDRPARSAISRQSAGHRSSTSAAKAYPGLFEDAEIDFVGTRRAQRRRQQRRRASAPTARPAAASFA